MKKMFKKSIKCNRNIKKYVFLSKFLLVNIIKVFTSEYLPDQALDLQISAQNASDTANSLIN